MTRPVYVTGGAAAFRWIQITDLNGADISGDVVKVALLPFEQKPLAADARDPDAQVRPSPSVIKAAIKVDNTFAPGMYTLWGRIQDVPELDWLEGGLVEVL
jgi:hypothetical protein